MKILLIEPDEIIGRITSDKLTGMGHIVAWEKTTQASLDALNNSLPEMVILEPSTGAHNGIELLYEMRSYSDWRDIPVVIYTSNHRLLDQEFVSPLSSLGVDIVIDKTHCSLSDFIKRTSLDSDINE